MVDVDELSHASGRHARATTVIETNEIVFLFGSKLAVKASVSEPLISPLFRFLEVAERLMFDATLRLLLLASTSTGRCSSSDDCDCISCHHETVRHKENKEFPEERKESHRTFDLRTRFRRVSGKATIQPRLGTRHPRPFQFGEFAQCITMLAKGRL